MSLDDAWVWDPSLSVARLSWTLLVFQSPRRNVAAAGKPDTVVLLGVLEALADHRLQGRPPADVTVQRDLHPLGCARLPFRVELIEGVLEAVPDDARGVARCKPHGEIILRYVGARQDHHRTFAGCPQERQIVAGVVAIPQVAEALQDRERVVRAGAARAGPADRRRSRRLRQDRGAPADVGFLLLI